MDDINVILADYPGLGRVRLCECNSIHLSIGPVTVNLAPEAFEQATALMRNALEKLKEISEAMHPESTSHGQALTHSSRLTH